MRVLLISHTCQSRTEGQPKAQCLGSRPGVDLRVLVPDRWMHYGKPRPPEPPPANASFDFVAGEVALPWAGPAQFYLHWYPQLARELEAFQPDVIDLWEEPWGLVSAHACWLRDRLVPDARVIVETEQNINKRLPPPFESFRAYSLRRADAAVARSREAAEILRVKRYTGPVHVVPNGVDTALFHPMDRDACRREAGFDGFVVGYVGRLVEEKGLADLVAALPLCESSVRLVFVGDGPMAEPLRGQARAMGVAHRVSILPARPLAELPPFMNAIDVLALCSRTTGRWKEQFGRVLAEAGSCGTPVIGSDSGAIPDVVGDGGLIAREQDPRSIAAAIEALRVDPARRRRLGEAGRRAAVGEFSWERVAERMHQIYAAALRAPRRSTAPRGHRAAARAMAAV